MDKKALIDCWTMFRREHDHVSTERMLCTRRLRDSFVAKATLVCGTNDEFEILWSLTNLRKKKEIPKNPNSMFGA